MSNTPDHNGLKPYSEYAFSNEPWLPERPKHWPMVKLKHVLAERSEKEHPNEPLLAATQTKGVVLKTEYENRTVEAMKDLHNLKLAVPGDFVISLRSFQGGIEYARCRGIISPAYTILYPHDPSVHGYLATLFKSQPFIGNLTLYVTGIRQGQNIDYTKLSASFVPIPPADERGAIVRFLGAVDRRVNRLVRGKRRLIELLTEQKQALITHAVTRGLNPNAELKPSGIDWLGDVPEHWEVLRLRHLVDEVTSGSRGWSQYMADSGPLFIRIGNLTRGSIELNLSDAARLQLPPHASEGRRTRVRATDILVSITAFIGSFAVVPDGIEEAYVSQHVALCRPRPSVHNARWVGYVLLSPVGQAHGSLSLNGGTKDGLSLDDVKNYPILLPPPEEQDRLVAWIERETAQLNASIAAVKREIALIREYRTRLVADVVTGKLDVRNALAEPVETIEPKPKANVHFRRSVFAAEIVRRLHAEPTFGHVKFEKLIYLCEKRCGVDTGSTYHRDAAGPYDNRGLRSIDTQMKKQGWYEARKHDKGYRYVPLAKAGAHTRYFDRYFGSIAAGFDAIVETFRTAKTTQCEIVATLFAAWDDLLAQGPVTDNKIIDQVLHHWHPSKQQIEEDRWRRALAWMRKKGLTPEGE